MSETTLKRLKDLREVVQWFENVPTVSFDEELDVHFDMNHFYQKDDCGTVACAWGAYTLSEYGQPHLALPQYALRNTVFGVPQARYLSPDSTIGHAARHFDIAEAEAEWLFLPDEYGEDEVPPHRVVKRIDQLIERYGG